MYSSTFIPSSMHRSICVFIHIFTYPPIYLVIYPASHKPYLLTSYPIYPSIYPSIVFSPIYSTIYPFIHPSLHPYVHPTIYTLSVYPSPIHPSSNHFSIHWSIYLSSTPQLCIHPTNIYQHCFTASPKWEEGNVTQRMILRRIAHKWQTGEVGRGQMKQGLGRTCGLFTAQKEDTKSFV